MGTSEWVSISKSDRTVCILSEVKERDITCQVKYFKTCCDTYVDFPGWIAGLRNETRLS